MLMVSSVFWQCCTSGESSSASVMPKDSVQILIMTKGKEAVPLGYHDDFGNLVNFDAGENVMQSVKTVEDLNQRVSFPLPDTLGRLDFYEENGYWFARSADSALNRLLNFEVFYRKEMDPVLPAWSFLKFYVPENKDFFKDPSIREGLINEHFRKKRAYLSAYAAKGVPDTSIVKVWEPILKYERLNYRLLLTKPDQWDKSYIKDLSDLKKEYKDEALLVSMPVYRKGLLMVSLFLDYLEYGNHDSFEKARLSIHKHFEGKHREFLMAGLLNRCKSDMSPLKYTEEEFRKASTEFLATCQTPAYKTYISRLISNDMLAVDDNEVLDLSGKKKRFDQLNDSALAYIDFWASWCGPCRAEMPDSKKLKEQFGRKGVRFIYISLDENPAAWQLAMKQLRLHVADSYIIPETKDSEILQKYKINSIPRYMIMDREGKVINANAPRPSDPQIAGVLEEALKNS